MTRNIIGFWRWRLPVFGARSRAVAGFRSGTTRIAVLATTEHRVRVRLLECGPRGEVPGYVTYVSKRNVTLTEPLPPEREAPAHWTETRTDNY